MADPHPKNTTEKAWKASQIPEVASLKVLLCWNKVMPCVLSGATYKVFGYTNIVNKITVFFCLTLLRQE